MMERRIWKMPIRRLQGNFRSLGAFLFYLLKNSFLWIGTKFPFLKKEGTIMATRKTTLVGFICILMTAWLGVFAAQVPAETTDEQKQALIGEWTGVWPGIYGGTSTLIIHEIDPEKAKARCTYIVTSGEKFPVLADFTPGPKAKIEFKLEDRDYKFVLSKSILNAYAKGILGGSWFSNQTGMKKKPK
jgi:hypothetical protein